MTELFLVPVSDDWIDDFHRTASRPVRIADDAPRELESLDFVRVWGTTEGDGVRKRSTFEAMAGGDLVLFYHHGEFFAAARVAQTVESAELGEWLWGNRESRFIFTLSDFEQISIPRAALWEVLGYDSAYPLYGFSRVSDQAISTLLERYDSIGEAVESLKGEWPEAHSENGSESTGEEFDEAVSQYSSTRLRSIVPMFGGATKYVETLDEVLDFVETHQPTTDELVGWNRGTFENVSSRSSIMRRVDYLEDAGFLQQLDDHWEPGWAGSEYLHQQSTDTLLRIMCMQNVGLRSLMYALSSGAMTIEEISDQQLDTHSQLGWTRGETDMAKQRTNWLRSMGLVQKRDDQYDLTEEGRQFIGSAVEEWINEEPSSTAEETFSVGAYETVTRARMVDLEFRATVLGRYDATCPISGVDHPGLLDVAHILPWGEYPDYRGDLANVLPLNKTHHVAFDLGLFTLDEEYRLQVNPSFETHSDLLEQSIVERNDERIPLPNDSVEPEYLRTHNATLEWW